MSTNTNVWLVSAALKEAAGDQATELMHKPSKHLANLTPHEVAQQPGGATIVLSELDDIINEARTEQ